MKTYRFVDTTEVSENNPSSIHTNIDNKRLENEIKGFQTLKVTGRERIGREIQSRKYSSTQAGGKSRTSANSSAGFGSNKIISSNLTSRTLSVEFYLENRNSREARFAWEKLNLLINKQEVEIWFSDDPEYFYTGTLINVGDVNPSVDSVISRFYYECMDPFKYRRSIQWWKFDNNGEFPQISTYPVRIESIDITPKRSTKMIKLVNETNGNFLQVDHDFKAGDILTFDLLNGKVLLNKSRDITGKLYWFSDFEDFSLSFRDLLKTNIDSNVVVNYRRKAL